jgi:hypothetical protein
VVFLFAKLRKNYSLRILINANFLALQLLHIVDIAQLAIYCNRACMLLSKYIYFFFLPVIPFHKVRFITCGDSVTSYCLIVILSQGVFSIILNQQFGMDEMKCSLLIDFDILSITDSCLLLLSMDKAH